MKYIITYKGIRGIIFPLFYLALLLSNHNIFGQCACAPISGNLVVDGGFEVACGSIYSFNSDMWPSCSGTNPIAQKTQGVFWVGSAHGFQSQWWATPQTGTGSFVGDGIWSAGSNRAWYQNVNVVAGNKYSFSFNHYEEQANSPTMSLVVNGVTVAQTGNAPAGQWNSLCGSWTATLTGSIELSIQRFSLGTGSFSNNDFSIDNISFVQIPNFKATPQTDKYLCHSLDPITLGPSILTGGSGNYSYKWSTGETTSQITVSPNVTTTYSVIITDMVTGCVTTDQIKVVVYNFNVALDPEVMICIAGATQLSPKVTGGSNNYSYLWSTGATSSSILVPYNSPGTYSVTVTDNVSGCSATATVRAAQWQCQGTKLYQNTSSLPSFSHYNVINAGYNVDNANPFGNVTVLNGQNVAFHGSSSVELYEGFTASAGSEFSADIITRCSFGNAYVQKNDIDVCTAKLSAIAEYGSGNYSYQWNTGATTRDIVVSPGVNTSYSVVITDNCLGSTATLTYNLDVHYRGALSFSYGNLVTPNGDGHNDTWVVTDNGKTQYAYNAAGFHLEIYNRWGAPIWILNGNVPINGTGFKEGDIYWNGHQSDGVYYYYLTLNNCDLSQSSKGWIQVLGGNYRIANEIATDSTSNSYIQLDEMNNLVKVSPNPSNGIFKYSVSSSENTIQEITVYDIYGSQIFVKEDEFDISKGTLNLVSQPGGVYFVHFKTSQGGEVKRILLNKH